MSIPIKYWLGNPEGRVQMIQLPSVGAGTQADVNRSEKAYYTAGGGVAVAHTPMIKRSWTFKRDWLTVAEQAALFSLYREAYGPGPYRLLDPSEVNRLGQEASTFGRFTGDTSFWLPTGPTLASVDTATVGPALESCIPSYTALATGQTIAGDTTTGLVQVPMVDRSIDWTFSIWARMSAGTALSAHLALTTLVDTQASSDVALSGTWQRLSLTVPGGTFTAGQKYITPKIVIGATVTGAPTLQLCGPQLENAIIASAYQAGLGIAVVAFSTSGAGGFGRTTPRTGFRSVDWVLAEL